MMSGEDLATNPADRQDDQPPRREWPGNSFVRWIVYTQLATICVAGVMSYHDRHGLYLKPGLIKCLCAPFGMWEPLSLFIYPILVFGWMLYTTSSPRKQYAIFLLEVLLLFTQLIAIQPMVQGR